MFGTGIVVWFGEHPITSILLINAVFVAGLAAFFWWVFTSGRKNGRWHG